jgi:hypothetical protein
MHSADRISGEDSGSRRLLKSGKQRGQLINPCSQFVYVVLHDQDAPDALQVDALVLGEPLDQP